MRCDFRWITPGELGDYWPTIKPGLIETAEKAPGDWTPQDVFLQIARGQAVLHIALLNQHYRGFIVSKTTESLKGKLLLIWILHGDGTDILIDSMEAIREWARNIGAAKIQMQSNRRGWERVAPKLGFAPTMTIYETDVKGQT